MKIIFLLKELIRICKDFILARLPLNFLKKKKNNDPPNYYSHLGYPANKLASTYPGHKEYQFVTTVDLNTIQIHPDKAGGSKPSPKWTKPKAMACSVIIIGEEENRGQSKGRLETPEDIPGESSSA